MSWQPVHPSWTTVSPVQADDLHWISYRAHRQFSSPFAAGIASSLAWVRGGSVAPITERAESPVTMELATAEMWAATAACTPEMSSPSLAAICAGLGVVSRSPLPVEVQFADGAWRTLGWLLGKESQMIPLSVPERNANGSVATGQQLFERAVEQMPWAYKEPERRYALRSEVETRASKSRKLARIIEDTRSRVTGQVPINAASSNVWLLRSEASRSVCATTHTRTGEGHAAAADGQPERGRRPGCGSGPERAGDQHQPGGHPTPGE